MVENQPITTRDDVVWCYRFLLGREPESEEAILSHLNNKIFRDLILTFTSSAEFVEKNSRQLRVNENQSRWNLHGLLYALGTVEVVATQSQLDSCLEKIRTVWEILGAEKPHFSVLTESRYLPEHINNSLNDFMRSGESEVSSLRSILKRHGLSDLSGLTCIEYGCGVGRLTGSLAKCFEKVHGYDISQQHLQLARQSVNQFQNVDLHLVPVGDLPALAPCDVYYSRIVLQHNPPPIIAELLRLALKSLRPGGMAVFQVPTNCPGYHFNLSEWLAQEPHDDMEMHCIPQWVVFELIAKAGCTVLEVREDNSTGAPDVFISNTFVARKI
jgi:2-polyprenyl-3-methyl-5-hydroxy-6-metoxy-1,4-benzoquinol methylase